MVLYVFKYSFLKSFQSGLKAFVMNLKALVKVWKEFEGIDEDIGCMPSNRLLKEKRAFRKGMSCSRTKEKKAIYTKSVNEG